MEIEKDVQSLLAEELEVLGQAGVNVAPDVRRVRLGDTYRAILEIEVADEISADVIVIGSRGLSALGALMLRSTTYKVLHSSNRPVLVVP